DDPPGLAPRAALDGRFRRHLPRRGVRRRQPADRKSARALSRLALRAHPAVRAAEPRSVHVPQTIANAAALRRTRCGLGRPIRRAPERVIAVTGRASSPRHFTVTYFAGELMNPIRTAA